jgi:Tol biopolymer transport system component
MSAGRALRAVQTSRTWCVAAALTFVLAGQFVWAGTADAAYPGRDGRIAFVRSGDVWTVRSDGAAPRRLTHTHDNYDPAWSPDGGLIAFASSRAGAGDDLWVMRADGSDKRRITFGPSDQSSPTWSPDGRWIAYSDDRGTTDDLPLAALFKIRATARHGRPIRLTRPAPEWPTGLIDTEAAWSPLGGTILFTREFPCVPCDEGNSELWQVTAAGGGEAPVLGIDTWAGAWAPRGRAYAWTSDYDADAPFGTPIDIYVHDADGTTRRLAPLPPDAEQPAWAPSGARIAYVKGSTWSSIWTIRRDGGGTRFVIGNATEPDWQPLIG